MNESIKNNGQKDISVIIDVRVEPVKEKDRRVVVHVQERELPPLFAEHDKDRIPKVPHLGNVKEPEQISRGRVLRIVRIARCQRVAEAVRQHRRFNRHVGAQHDLRDIVKELNGVQAHGRNSQLHNSASNQDKEDVRERNVKGGRKVSQRPSLFEDNTVVRKSVKWGSVSFSILCRRDFRSRFGPNTTHSPSRHGRA